MVFFYDVPQRNGQICGGGAILKLPDSKTYSLKMNARSGSNTRGELIVL